jgi:hypothetical protein
MTISATREEELAPAFDVGRRITVLLRGKRGDGKGGANEITKHGW